MLVIIVMGKVEDSLSAGFSVDF